MLLGANVLLMFGMRCDPVHISTTDRQRSGGDKAQKRKSVETKNVTFGCRCSCLPLLSSGWLNRDNNQHKDSELLCILLPLVCNNRVCDFAQKAPKCHSTLVARTDKLKFISNSLLTLLRNNPLQCDEECIVPGLLPSYC